MTPRPWLAITSIIALLVGIVLGLLLVPNLRTRAHLDDVASSSFDDRQRAWEWLKSSPGPFPLEQINLALRDAPPEALLHGARELQRVQSWDWSTQSNDVMARYMTLLLWRSHIMDTEDVIVLIGQSPADMPDDTMLELGATLFNHPDETVARRGFHALLSWSGHRPILARVLDQLPDHRLDWGLHYRSALESGRGPMLVAPSIVQAAEEAASADDHLLFHTVRSAAMHDDPIWRQATARRWLEDDAAETPMDAGAAPSPGPERRMAGALLAAHEDIDPRVIEHAMVVEQDATTRTVMRLAIDSIGPTWNDDDPTEFARRALPDSDGIPLYPMYCRMLAGDLTLLGPLLDAAADGPGPARARAIALIAWLMPDWIDTAPDIGAAAMKEDIFLQRLHARWRLEHRWVVNSAHTPDDVTHD
jgi:hypothetical protein